MQANMLKQNAVTTRCIQDQIEKSKKYNSSSYKGNYSFEFLKASIADLLTLPSSSVQNSEVVVTEALVVLTPSKSLKWFLEVTSGLLLVK
jgi:hypothetical protein